MNNKGQIVTTLIWVSLIGTFALFLIGILGGTGLAIGIFRGLRSIPQLVWWGFAIFMVIFLIKRAKR